MTTTDTEGRLPSPIDVAVGANVRRIRKAMGLSQDRLAQALGLTFQQVQKYERGANRISASKLYEIARFLGRPINAFYEGLGEPETGGVGMDEATATANLQNAMCEIGQPLLLDLARLPSQDRGHIAALARRLVGGEVEAGA